MIKNKNILLFFIVGLLILIVYNYNNYTNNPTIIFLPKENLSFILKNDIDNYYNSISKYNLKFRNIENRQDFLNNIHTFLYECNNKEKNIISKAIQKANDCLKTITYPGFYYKKLQHSPWLIGCSKSSNYEFGYPHTRYNVIILNYNNIYDKNLYKTLIHERVHIYQKLFPDDIQEFLTHYNFKKIKVQNQYDRANPDTDNYIYQKDNIIFECKIESPYINNFYDFNNNELQLICTNNSDKYEHPYEFMAYEISELSN